MARLQTSKPRVQSFRSNRVGSSNVSVRRITGRALQERRFRIWSLNPHCEVCNTIVIYPHGFELDHKVPLYLGGADVDANCQVLCVFYDEQGEKRGCHAAKTAADLRGEIG